MLSKRFTYSGVQWVATIGLGLVLWAFLRLFLIEAFRIPSSSMAPGLLPGDMVLVSKIAYGPVVAGHHFPGLSLPQRGDLVVFESLETPGMMVVKRLVALPGDTVAVKDGLLLIDGLPADEPYLSATVPDPKVDSVMAIRLGQWTAPLLVRRPVAGLFARSTVNNWGPIRVPADSMLVLGDNRAVSYDSRFWGLLPVSRLRGSPITIYFSSDPDGGLRPRWSRMFKEVR
jgi:signal peptidase I